RFPGSVSARDVEVTLADGRAIRADRAAVDHGTWSATVRLEEFGTVEAKGTLSSDGALAIDAAATAGPVRSAKLDLGTGAEKAALRISAELVEPPALRNHPLAWEGSAFFEQGRIARVEGELTVKEGRARTRVDLAAGRVDADVDGVIAVDQEFKGDLAVTARAEGPLSGPKEAWSIREGREKTKNAKVRTIRIDEADVSLGAGSLSEISFKGGARSGEDRVAAEGFFRWPGKDPEVDAKVDLSAADAAPYLALLAEPPRIKCREIRAKGTFRLKEAAASYDGRISTGDGGFERTAWKSLAFDGTLGADKLEARDLVVEGTAYAPKIAASGKLE
ncbi:MAG: hypothetical protein L0323_24170, partial [Planctomycetes bacterium]|nr:hypothetical protein [Planctomycetota bacterium]